jgi:hypothetical protein
VDREPIARARRRQQVQEHLAEQRELEASLRDELEERIAEVEGPKLDEQVFAQMDPADAKLVRDGLAGIFEEIQPDEASFWTEEEASFWDDDQDTVDSESPEALEEEIARLERELETCRRRQRAYERYLALLG